ncbi:MAG: NADP-dependent oxidoreductase [Pseudomonadales bacterium]|nr:NADP-dependent oxidoreductase [Pseudomonadales bacterium]MBO6564763.1 NADP-dependent oxidoreductase [Pseudomonadales bacterium]MBO6597906.1 NADP-dependent oxidoreductase [Pseudomonadales bacterium]MBO6658444.1 NADP-dependent oxidoreductase [Pseudomonadales bacterium]MBO6824313.1 NADP-dependent oxidoreductase [Pseudomonadales bacterium]
MENTRVILKRRPVGEATSDCFAVESEILGALPPGKLRVGVEYISVDAGTRTMLRGEGFHMQVGIGEPILAGGVGRILESNVEGWEPGQAVRGGLCAQTIATVSPEQLEKIEETHLPLSAWLGVLGGSTGVTAWIGVRRVAKPGPGEVFVVSAAAGAVGSIAGQIAKRDGARVIGIAGGQRKTDYLTNELGFDAAIDYKSEDMGARLKELAPEGVNVFFDNVGGAVLDAVLDNIAMRSRVVICGAVSQYDDMDNVSGPSMYLRLAERQSIMEGFAYFHFPESIPEATRELKDWAMEGSIAMPEEILDGIDRYPDALQFMFQGGNLGKLLVKAH